MKVTKEKQKFSFERLDVWQKAVQLYVEIDQLTKRFPKAEQYGLTAQLRNSALSVSLNIAEGAGRVHKKEFKQFIGIARGSLFETASNLYACRELSLINGDELDYLTDQSVTIAKMLNALRNSLN